MLGGENVRELLCVRVYFGQQFLKSSGGIMRVGVVVSGCSRFRAGLRSVLRLPP